MTKSKHTPGPWQVVTDVYPHKFGGKHVERRIFTQWVHPQLKSCAPVVNMSAGIGPKDGAKGITFVSISEADAHLIAAAPALLAACEAMSAHYSASLDHQPAYVRLARAAIAEAKQE